MVASHEDKRDVRVKVKSTSMNVTAEGKTLCGYELLMQEMAVAVLFPDTSFRHECPDIRCHDFSALADLSPNTDMHIASWVKAVDTIS